MRECGTHRWCLRWDGRTNGQSDGRPNEGILRDGMTTHNEALNFVNDVNRSTSGWQTNPGISSFGDKFVDSSIQVGLDSSKANHTDLDRATEHQIPTGHLGLNGLERMGFDMLRCSRQIALKVNFRHNAVIEKTGRSRPTWQAATFQRKMIRCSEIQRRVLERQWVTD